jgi:N6-L-threonylcarbamoyladenine synthase
VAAALDGMTAALLAQFGDLPLVYAGGVMSNSILRAHFSETYGGRFAPPAYSADNAVGIAYLCRIAEEGEG